MGQKINPIGFRLGVIKGWDSNWYGGKDFAEKLHEDQQIRKYVLARIPKGGIAKVIIERTLKRITLTIHTARPGVVIGKGGAEVDKLKEELKKITNKDIQINIFEIKRPELDAKLVGESIAQQLQARISFRRAMKQAIAATMRVGAEGIKVGIKVWIFKGEVYGVRDLSPNQGASNEPKGQRTPAPKGREKDGPKRRKRNS